MIPFLGFVLAASAEFGIRISRLRNRPNVSPSGTWLLESAPQKSEKVKKHIALKLQKQILMCPEFGDFTLEENNRSIKR